MNILRNILGGVSSAVLALGLIAAAPAYALVTEGDASAYAIQATIIGDPVIGPIPYSSISGNGEDHDSVLDISVGPLSIEALNSSAYSNVDGSAGPKAASAYASILDVDFSLNHLMGLSVDAITSDSHVTGDYGTFATSGSSSIVGLSGSGLLSGLNDVTITGVPNQVLFSLFGIEVIANRQTSTCSATDCFMMTDALYVDVFGKANVVLASSYSHLAAPIPEPATAAMMLAGLAGLGSKRLRNKVKKAAA